MKKMHRFWPALFCFVFLLSAAALSADGKPIVGSVTQSPAPEHKIELHFDFSGEPTLGALCLVGNSKEAYWTRLGFFALHDKK